MLERIDALSARCGAPLKRERRCDENFGDELGARAFFRLAAAVQMKRDLFLSIPSNFAQEIAG